MKKWTILILAMGMTLALAACGGKNAGTGSGAADSKPADAVQVADARELLTAIWALHGEDEKFPAMGGDFDEKNMTNDAPGNYGLGDAEALDTYLRLPASALPMIDGAASLMHMMNANTFTCGAFHVSDSANVSAVADALKENILSTQWMCGFPEKLIVMAVGDYVISAFGNGELIDTFRDKAISAYPSAQLLHEQVIE